jgi:hypothetical protein
VLQNKKYIAFAEENTVEVLVLDRLEEGIEKDDRRAARYKGKDGSGQEVELLVGWPNLTVEDVKAMRSTKANTYNNTGKIPYTSVIDPYTLEEMGNIKGGFGVGMLTDLVEAKRKELVKQHGRGTSRRSLKKVQEADREIREQLAGGNLAKALADTAALEKKMAKESPAVIELVGKTKAEVLAAAGKHLDELEATIERGEKAAALKQLGPLSRALKGTPLEERALELLEKAKAA